MYLRKLVDILSELICGSVHEGWIVNSSNNNWAITSNHTAIVISASVYQAFKGKSTSSILRATVILLECILFNSEACTELGFIWHVIVKVRCREASDKESGILEVVSSWEKTVVIDKHRIVLPLTFFSLDVNHAFHYWIIQECVWGYEYLIVVIGDWDETFNLRHWLCSIYTVIIVLTFWTNTWIDFIRNGAVFIWKYVLVKVWLLDADRTLEVFEIQDWTMILESVVRVNEDSSRLSILHEVKVAKGTISYCQWETTRAGVETRSQGFSWC